MDNSPPPAPRILIACIGNIFLGDDAFGVEVAKHLATRTLPPTVRAEDFGIRGIDLTYALLDGCDIAILVDAAPRGEAPGTLYVIEPSIEQSPAPDQPQAGAVIEGHTLDPAAVLRLVHSMDGRVRRVLVVGCEPAPLAPDEMAMGLTPPVQAAVEPAVAMIESLLENLLREEVPVARRT